MNEDGSIVLKITPDTTGLKRDMAKVSADIQRGFEKAGVSIDRALSAGDTKLAKMVNTQQKAIDKMESHRQKAAELQDEISKIQTEKIESSTTKQLSKDLEKARAELARMGEELARVDAEVDAAWRDFQQYPNEVTRGIFTEAEARATEQANLYDQQVQKVDELAGSLENAYGANTQNKVDQLNAKLNQEVQAFANASNSAQIGNEQIQNSLIETDSTAKTVVDGITSSMSRVGDGLGQIGKRILRTAKTILFFNLFRRLFTNIRQEIGNVLMSNEQFRESVEKLKEQLWTLAAPIIERVMPVLIRALDVISRIVEKVTALVAKYMGTSVSSMQKSGKAIRKNAKEYEKLKGSMDSVTKSAKKQLAAFDDLQILTAGDTDTDTLTTGAATEKTDLGAEEIVQQIAKIMAAVGLGMIAVGLILLLFGQVLPGLKMIALGALTAYGAAQISEQGFGKMLDDFFRENWKLVLAISGAMVVLGIILILAGQILPGIGLVAIGGAGLAKEASINSNAINAAIREFFVKNKEMIAALSAALLVMGILLCMVGIYPLGIGMIAVGAVGLAGVAHYNFGAIKNDITRFFKENKDLIAAVSGGLLLLGVLLCMAGIIPLGIGLIAAGAGGLAADIAINKDEIVDFFKETWNKITTWWNENVAPVFTGKFWKDLAIKCGNGLISGFEKAVNAIIGLFEDAINWIVDGLNKISFDIPDWLGGGKFGISISRAKLGRLSIPRLAEGGIVPRRMLAEIGERGKEAVLPLEQNTEWMDTLAERIAKSNSSKQTTVILEIDGREFGRAVVEMGNQENRRIGTRLVRA